MRDEWGLNEALMYISSHARFGLKPGLTRTKQLLACLGHPEANLRFVHVAGTNGKGSTCAYLAEVMQCAGYVTGLYTSPYLSAFADRMSIDGKSIADNELVTYAGRIREVMLGDPVLQEDPPTEFEITTALSFLYFSAHAVQIVILETGLGGRFDATNVVTKEISVITNVSYDHTEILGTRLEEIAYDKAGIISPQVPIITATQGIAYEVIRRVANEQNANCLVMGRDFRTVVEETSGTRGQRFSYFGVGHDYVGLQLRMLGPHQVQNAAVALCALECLMDRGWTIDDHAIRQGFAQTRWPGRLEVVQDHPLVVLDGAHNPAGARALAVALSVIGIKQYVLVVGAMKDKDIMGIIQAVSQGAVYVVTMQSMVKRAASATQIGEIARQCLPPTVVVEAVGPVGPSLKRALFIAQSMGPDIGVCVMGTLYAVAEAREILTAVEQA